MEIYLASKSPRRRELLDQIGVRYSVVDVDVVEQIQVEEMHDRLGQDRYVKRLALSKARAGIATLPNTVTVPGRAVLGADTIVCCDDAILEKPRNESEARVMLETLSNRWHRVKTAVALVTEAQELVDMSVTEVLFRNISPQEISAYWASGEPRDKAGGYGIQGKGAVFVREIRGSYSAVVGLPIELLDRMFVQLGIPVWHQN